MEKKNVGMKVAIVILSLLVVGLILYLVFDKLLSSDDNNSNSYEFGDNIILESLSNVNYSSIGFSNENGDFSEWKVLKDEGEYIILYYSGDESLYGKADKDETINKYNERKILFTENGIDFGDDGDIRIINENDLLLFGCDFDTLICSNLPDWINGWTSYTKDNFKYTLSNGKLNPIEEDNYVLAISSPIIKILKSNIK